MMKNRLYSITRSGNEVEDELLAATLGQSLFVTLKMPQWPSYASGYDLPATSKNIAFTLLDSCRNLLNGMQISLGAG